MTQVNTTPGRIKALNGWLTWFWAVQIPPVCCLYFLLDSDRFQSLSLLYLSVVSLWALVASHATAWVAARTEEDVKEAAA